MTGDHTDPGWLRRQLEAGRSINDIAAAAGVTRQAIQKQIRRHEHAKPPATNRRHPHRPSNADLATDYAKLGNLSALARSYGVDRSSVTEWLRQARIPVVRRAGRPPKSAGTT